ncbi:CAP domain-containing protein [Myxococcaceae bacterium GXIMD 01537]
MIPLALGLVLALSPLVDGQPSVDEMEQRAARHLADEFQKAGRPAPRRDGVLDIAARRLAREALTDFTTGAPDLLTLTAAVSDAGAADPSPTSLLLRASEPQHALDLFFARARLGREPATHFGVGAVDVGDRVALLLLLAERKATLQPFARTLPQPGERRRLCGHLAPPLTDAEVYLTRPGGQVEAVPVLRESATRFCASLPFDAPGRSTVEVVGTAQGGPEVAALLLVDVGGKASAGEREALIEPTTVEDSRARILERINALRGAHGLAALTRDETLEQVAQAYSERMAREDFFAHVAPDGSTLRSRLPKDNPAYRAAGENLSMAAGPLAAHFGIEHSPGHRKNLLEPAFRLVGIGVAFKQVEGRDRAVLTELFTFTPPPSPQEHPYR